MIDNESVKRLQSVNRILAGRVNRFADELLFDIRITQSYRTPDEQRAYYAQGRMGLRAVNSLRKTAGLSAITLDENSETITENAPYHTWHEYGLAVDVVPIDQTTDFNEAHPVWMKMVTIARQCKLLDGVSHHHELHLQPVELPITPTPIFISLLQDKKIEDVWEQACLDLRKEENV